MSTREVALIPSFAFLVLGACSSGGDGDATAAGGDFVAEKTDPVNGATIYLNDPINVDFSAPVDLDSASLTTMSFEALDQNGNLLQELVTGNFTLAKRPGDDEPGRRLQFVPSFATNNTFSDGGFRSGRTYLVSLIGGSNATTVLRGRNGKELAVPITFRFSTRDGTQPAQLYRNPRAGGPRRDPDAPGAGLEVTTATDLQNVPLALFGAPPLEVRMHFDQAINPSDTNVPVALDTNPLVRDESLKGRVYLEYKDPVYDSASNPDDFTWLPADVEVERNDLTGSTIALRPIGVLPNNATIRVIAEQSLEDIAGESNLGTPSFNRVFGVFRTQSAFEQQWNGIVEDFTSSANVDLTAAFPESTAEVGPGYLRAGFAFEGTQTSRNYAPTTAEVVLNTAFTQIVPETGPAFTVNGGVFNFDNVTIPQGVLVRGTGPNPMVWLCSGKFTVGGTLSVQGGDGARVDTLTSANFAKAGGVAGPAGGNGGDGTPSATLRDLTGGNGRGPLQAAGKGGRGGKIACDSTCISGNSGGGSGGGGGSMATQGDPHYRGTVPGTLGSTGNNASAAANAFQQVLGFGGAGCGGASGTRTAFLAGGTPGEKVFTDTRADNDFWGSGIRLDGNALRITGELEQPMGGGGGGGGDRSPSGNCEATGPNPAGDNSGGGGGGGGGVLIVKALEEITILSTGKIIANGGNGGGGEQAGSCNQGGGGGGGAGGMVILMSAKAIRIEAHGSGNRFVYGAPTPLPGGLYAGDDYDFAISADGGVCRTGGSFGGGISNTGKYVQNGAPMAAGADYDANPLGGLGGMGIVQLMVPPGDNGDGTNTILDDNIQFFAPGELGGANPQLVPVANKKQLLAWRGFPNPNGPGGIDDFGNQFDIGKNEGDIRPAPVLLPVPFAARSRAQSKWIDTGASQRRALTAPDGGARGVVLGGGAEVGPRFEFAGTDPATGYVAYDAQGTSGVTVDYGPPAVGATPVTGTANATWLGTPAYRITLAAAALGQDDRFVQHEAELLGGADVVLARFRILSHTSSELLVDATTSVLPANIAKLRVARKFFEIATAGGVGLGPVRVAQQGGGSSSLTAVPIANLRIGFAFHWDFVPGNEATNRYPETGFVYDLEDPLGLPAAIQAQGRPPRYVKWDVLFDLAYDPGSVVGEPLSLSASTPRPELRFLRLPFRF